MLRRLAQLWPPLATATLALLTTAWAATGHLPLTSAEPARALVVRAQATGPLVAGDADGRAILTADAMAPGATTAGTVTIANAGDTTGAFSLSTTARTDRGGPAAGLSSVLDLTVLDTTGAEPVTLYAGTLAAFGRVALGSFDAGAARRYRFVVTYPANRPGALDDPYQGASTSIAFVWDAAGTGQAGEAVPAPVPAPTAVSGSGARAPGAGTAAGGAGGAGSAAAAPARPVAPLRLGLGVRSRRIARGRLATRMWSSARTRARVSGTVTVGRKRMRLRAVSVTLTARRRTVRVRLPKAALAAGRPRRLTVRLVVTATAAGRKATLRRTVRVTR